MDLSVSPSRHSSSQSGISNGRKDNIKKSNYLVHIHKNRKKKNMSSEAEYEAGKIMKRRTKQQRPV
jgi:hypothetical protein